MKAVINGLPYNEAGYKRAKEILERKYGIQEEIVAAFVKEITDLPRIATANPKKVEEFYAKLNVAVNDYGQNRQCGWASSTDSKKTCCD